MSRSGPVEARQELGTCVLGQDWFQCLRDVLEEGSMRLVGKLVTRKGLWTSMGPSMQWREPWVGAVHLIMNSFRSCMGLLQPYCDVPDPRHQLQGTTQQLIKDVRWTMVRDGG